MLSFSFSFIFFNFHRRFACFSTVLSFNSFIPFLSFPFIFNFSIFFSHFLFNLTFLSVTPSLPFQFLSFIYNCFIFFSISISFDSSVPFPFLFFLFLLIFSQPLQFLFNLPFLPFTISPSIHHPFPIHSSSPLSPSSFRFFPFLPSRPLPFNQHTGSPRPNLRSGRGRTNYISVHFPFNK